jgi:hypothetical protein
MTDSHPRWSGPIGAAHPAVLDRRIRDILVVGGAGLIAAGLGLGIALRVPNPNVWLLLGITLGGLGILTLLLSSRLELTVMLLALYLGLLDGPIKLGTGGHEAASVVRDVLIFAVCLGAVLRLLAKRERVKLPPLSGWVLTFVGMVVIEAFNPSTHGILHILGGFRQQLEWVPFFFFGYTLMRSKQRFRALFLIVGVIGLANAVVATYQTALSPAQVASWGPGYRNRIYPEGPNGEKRGGRTYGSEGEGRVRPFGLGSDSGFSGGVGVLALPLSLALLATWRARRRWLAAVFSLAAIVGVATGLARTQVIGAVLAVGFFALLSLSAGRRVTRPVAAILAVVVLAVPLGALFVSSVRSGTFSRYESIRPGNAEASSTAGYKSAAWSLIPHEISVAPFGVGLGTVGAAGGFGGKTTELLEGHGVSAETQLNFVTDEIGAPGLVFWFALTITLIVLAVRRLRHVQDIELRIELAGVFAPFVAMVLMGFEGPIMTSAALGPYFWFATGVAGYWFAGPGRGSSATSGGVPA